MAYGYLFLAAALFFGSIKAFCGKKSSNAVSVYSDAFLINALRMSICTCIGILLPICSKNAKYLWEIDRGALMISLLSGVATAWFVVSWIVAVRSNAYMMVDVFLMLSTVIPMVGSCILFHETIRPIQWGGYLLLLLAVVLLCQYSSQIKEKLSVKSLLLLVSSGAANGIVDLSQKGFVQRYPAVPISVYQFYTYLVAALFLWIILAASSTKQKPICRVRGIIGYVIIMAVCLFLNSYFKTWAAVILPSSQLYPLNQGTALIISTTMAAVFFKEKLTLKSILGICLAFAALCIMNLL